MASPKIYNQFRINKASPLWDGLISWIPSTGLAYDSASIYDYYRRELYTRVSGLTMGS